MWVSVFYYDGLIRDLIACFLSFVAIQSCVSINHFFVSKKIIDNKIGRKLVHIFVGISSILCWTLFSDSLMARFFSALVPLIFSLFFLVTGRGWKKPSKEMISFTRNNDCKELLFGPLHYSIVLTVITMIFWRDSPIGVFALILLSIGDGLADLVGRRWGVNPLPFNKNKSWEGFIAMFISSFIFGLFFIAFFYLLGYYQVNFIELIPTIWVIALFSTFIESITIGKLDNLTISASSVLLGVIFQL